jgi:2'-5' RNA ligase
VRTFIAIELDPAVRRPLVQLLRGLPRDREVRWCSEAQLHVTLKFLGEVPEERIEDVCEAVAAAARQVPPFAIRVSGLGGFPGRRSPRVLWCGVEDASGSTRRWVELADPLLAALGYPREERAYTPHITLGRARSPGGGRIFERVLESTPAPDTPQMQVAHVIVFESRLSPQGAQYRPVRKIALGS